MTSLTEKYAGKLNDASSSNQRPDGSHVLRTTANGAVELVAWPNGTTGFMAKRAVPAGTVLFEEQPVACVTVIAKKVIDARPAIASLLPDNACTIDELTSEHPELEGLDPALEWLLTYALLVKDADRAKATDQALHMTNNMPQPGEYAAARRLVGALATGEKLPDGIRGWVACLMRYAGGTLSIEDAIMLQGIVARAALHMRTPLSRVPYGVALYIDAAHAAHSCQPTAHVVFGPRGTVTLVAARAIEPGTPITIHRTGPPTPLMRCLQTAPAWIRQNADNATGCRCTCSECRATLAWLRESAGETDGVVAPEHAEKVLRIVEEVWTTPETPDTSTDALPKDVRRVIEWPLALTQVSGGSELILTCDAAALNAQLAALMPPNVVWTSVAHAILQAAVQMPGTLVARYGLDAATRLIDDAGGYYVLDGGVLTARKLAEQGADPHTVARQMLSHRAYSTFLAFAARAACQATPNTMDPAVVSLLRDAWVMCLVYYNDQTDVSTPGTMPEHVTALVTDMMHVESSMFPRVAAGLAMMAQSGPKDE